MKRRRKSSEQSESKRKHTTYYNYCLHVDTLHIFFLLSFLNIVYCHMHTVASYKLQFRWQQHTNTQIQCLTIYLVDGIAALNIGILSLCLIESLSLVEFNECICIYISIAGGIDGSIFLPIISVDFIFFAFHFISFYVFSRSLSVSLPFYLSVPVHSINMALQYILFAFFFPF